MLQKPRWCELPRGARFRSGWLPAGDLALTLTRVLRGLFVGATQSSLTGETGRCRLFTPRKAKLVTTSELAPSASARTYLQDAILSAKGKPSKERLCLGWPRVRVSSARSPYSVLFMISLSPGRQPQERGASPVCVRWPLPLGFQKHREQARVH